MIFWPDQDTGFLTGGFVISGNMFYWKSVLLGFAAGSILGVVCVVVVVLVRWKEKQ